MSIELLHKEPTEKIIRVYYDVYNRLSRTYPEFIYERAMMVLLERNGVQCSRQDEYEIRYKGQVVGVQRLDLFVTHEVAVELKIGDHIQPIHRSQLVSYMKTVAAQVGMLFSFGGLQPTFARRVLTSQDWNKQIDVKTVVAIDDSSLLHAELIYHIIGGLLEVFQALGPGFIHRIYANACYQELKLRSLEVIPLHEFRVFLDDLDLGAIKLGHLQVENTVLVFPVATANMATIEIDNLKAWMRHLNIPLGIVANFYTIHLQPVILRI